ncbi:MAG: hypothetical protein R2788_26230 [Saprospiraceae bacterium]
MPGVIEHKTWGYGELEIIVDDNEQKGVCYRHKNKSASFGTYGLTWSEVYEKLRKTLIENDHLHT